MIELITEVTLYPDGMEPGDSDAHVFALKVQYRGEYHGKHGGGYSVSHTSSELQRKSREWSFYVERFRRWQYRWPDLESALEAAREEVNNVTVNGRTWAQWQEFHGRQKADV